MFLAETEFAINNMDHSQDYLKRFFMNFKNLLSKQAKISSWRVFLSKFLEPKFELSDCITIKAIKFFLSKKIILQNKNKTLTSLIFFHKFKKKFY